MQTEELGYQIENFNDMHVKDLEIQITNLTKIYITFAERFTAVDEINLEMQPGIHGLLGPNGSGKTSIIKMLIGAIKITKGKAKIRNYNAGSVNARKIIGYLPQDPIFYDNMTGEKYLIFRAQMSGLKKKEAKQKTQELLEMLELTDVKGRKIGKYSGGMRQRIGFASAIIHDPKILILDEPTANLDPIGRNNIIDKIIELSRNMSVFVSSHILSEIEQMCNKVTIIDEGKIILTDTIKNIKEKYSDNSTNKCFTIDTDCNQKILHQIKEKININDAWIDKKTQKIQVAYRNLEEFQEKISLIIFENKANIREIQQSEISLQDIFIDIINNGEEVIKK